MVLGRAEQYSTFCASLGYGAVWLPIVTTSVSIGKGHGQHAAIKMKVVVQVQAMPNGPIRAEQVNQSSSVFVDKTKAGLALACLQLYSAVVYTVVLAQSVQRMDYSINVKQYN